MFISTQFPQYKIYFLFNCIKNEISLLRMVIRAHFEQTSCRRYIVKQIIAIKFSTSQKLHFWRSDWLTQFWLASFILIDLLSYFFKIQALHTLDVTTGKLAPNLYKKIYKAYFRPHACFKNF